MHRWSWRAAGGLLVAAAALTGWSVWQHWLPCRGSMLEGTWLGGPTTEFSDACLRRMDSGIPFPYPPEVAEQTAWASEIGALAMLLAAVAWLVVVTGLTVPDPLKAAAVLPSLLTAAAAVLCFLAARSPSRPDDDPVALGFWLGSELVGLAVLILLGATRFGLGLGVVLRLGLVLWGATAFGLLHQIFDYVGMIAINEANWDTPPGTGYGTALVLLVAGISTLILARTTGTEPDPTDQRSVYGVSSWSTGA